MELHAVWGLIYAFGSDMKIDLYLASTINRNNSPLAGTRNEFHEFRIVVEQTIKRHIGGNKCSIHIKNNSRRCFPQRGRQVFS